MLLKELHFVRFICLVASCILEALFPVFQFQILGYPHLDCVLIAYVRQIALEDYLETSHIPVQFQEFDLSMRFQVDVNISKECRNHRCISVVGINRTLFVLATSQNWRKVNIVKMGLVTCKCQSDLGDSDNDSLYGRRPERNTFQSRYSYVHWKICKEYLKCEILPWKKLPSLEHPITLESLPTQFLDENHLRKCYFYIGKDKYLRVVGFRELLMKREYAEFLRDLDKSMTGAFKQHAKRPGVLALPSAYFKLARGGVGHNPPHPGTGKKPAAAPHAPQTHGKPAVPHISNPSGKPAAHPEPPRVPPNLRRISGDDGILVKFTTFLKGILSNRTPTKKELKRQELMHRSGRDKVEKAKDPQKMLHQQMAKKWKWPHRRKRLPRPKNRNLVVLLHRLYRLPKESQERDMEWYYLSDTDPDEHVLQSFDKGLHTWMTQGISFESQKLVNQMRLFLSCLTLTGRSFLHLRKNFARGHIEFSSKKHNILPFAITSLVLWSILCLFFCSFMDINAVDAVVPNNFVKLEMIELRKYWLPFLLTLGNLILVAFWSLTILLGDGAMIAHHLNCWCAALHEMETSAALDIRKLTMKNLQLYTIHAALFSLMFVFNKPTMIRGYCGLTAMLLLRPGVPFLRVSQPAKLLFYEWIGFGVHLYIIFSARMVMTLLQIFALMLKNVCEMWNFKFALTFKMLAEQNRGQLYQFQLNHSLAKLWNHHRLITLLLEHYGLVFCTAIMSYIIPQGLIFAIALAKLPFYDGSSLREFYGNQTDVLVYSDAEPTIIIPYYNKTYEHLLLALLVLLQTGIDFIFTSETLISAQNAYMTGAEFVRRAGIMTSSKSHERKLLFSLQWSFSPTRLHALTANRYFVMNRASLLKIVSIFVLIFTILLRMQTPENLFKLEFPPRGSCNAALGQTLVRGICTVKIEPVTPHPPLPPPNFYYFFMEDCPRIELKNMSQFNSSFEYFSVGTHSASQPPFQICKVGVNNGTSLSQDLRNIGRFFEDYGNRRLKETLELYLEQTFDPNSKDFTSVTAPSADLYPDTTDGGYCGTDVSGQPKERCEWVEYYRDCVVVCFSRRLKRRLLIPLLFKKDPVSNVFSLYNDYNEVDCGINPFGFKWFSTDPKDAAYDCFGNKMSEADYDECGNLPFIEPAPPFTPAIGHHFQLYRGYSSKWEKPEKSFPAAHKSNKCPLTCYNSDIGRIRCSQVDVTENLCALSKYSGVTISGYFYIQQCFELTIHLKESPKPTGFCKHEVTAGAIEIGHAISTDFYASAKTNQWQATFNLVKGLLPCYNYETLREIEKNVYFYHACIDPSSRATDSCPVNTASVYFTAFRPYHLECDSKLKQIAFNYENDDGNKPICDIPNKVMIVPPAKSTKFIVDGSEKNFTLFYGCHGKPLLPPQMGYPCLFPVVAGVCEVNFGIFRLLSSDCTNEAINATGFITTGMTQFGFCDGHIDLSHNLFENFSRKLVYQSLYDDLLKYWKDPWSTPMTIRNAPGSTSCNEQLNERYCGSNSVALHYPFDGYDSSGDKFLCNWEVYLRDCLTPYQTPFFRTEITTVYLPSFVEKKTLKLDPFQRKLDALLNTFVVGSDPNDFVTCEGRSYPGEDSTNSGGGAGGIKVDPYWMDDCGWVITPEFIDGDPKGLAIMAPILPIAREKVFGALGDFVDNVIHCYQSEYAIARCTHPDVFPICKKRLSVWEPSLGQIDVCYKFGSDCFTDLNKQPAGAKNDSVEDYPDGFCKGYCPFTDTALEGSVSQSTIDVWKTAESLEFESAPCDNSTNSSDKASQQIFQDPAAPRQIELQLFFQVHCSDPSLNQGIRDPRGPISGSFHWPLYRSSSGKLKLIPRESLVQHLMSTFGPGCDYKTQENEGKIYPASVEVEPNVTISRDDFVGCHGYPLYWLTGEFSSNPEGLNVIGITDPYRDYKKACFGDLLGGWCEADVQHYYFLKEDFEVTCKSKECPSDCTKNQGLYSSTPLAKVVAEDANYSFFVKTIYKVASKPGNPGDPSAPSTQLPFRRLSQQDYNEIHEYWQNYKGNHSQRSKHYFTFIQRSLRDPLSTHCHHTELALFHKYCTWKRFLEQCYVPCHLIAPNYTVTLVSESIVDGQGSNTQEMYLQPLRFEKIHSGKAVAAYSFADCVIDPVLLRKHRGVYDCRLQKITEFDSFGWGLRDEFFPDPGAPGQYKLSLPQKIPFSFNLLKDYVDPSITYNPNPTNESMKTVTKEMYASPYFNCIRVSTESMRNAILTATESYWTSTVVQDAVMIEHTYRYYPTIHPVSNPCGALPVRILLFWKACKLWNIPSRVKRIYGFCEAIFPIGLVHSSYAALIEPITPPEGCLTREVDAKEFDIEWGRNRSYGLSSSVESDVYPEWNNYCEGCGYTRSMHRRNVIKAWIGEKKHANPHCLPSTENKMSTGELEFPQTVGSKWNKTINDVVVLWKLRAEYSCWNETKKEWQFNVRPTTYHPYGIRHESGDMCQRIMPIALNALDCPSPCKSEDESEDCNSRCPHVNHNICDQPLDTLFNLKPPLVGLNYYVFLTENGSPCKIHLQGMMEKVQGIGIFGPFGRNIVQCQRGEIAQCRTNRRGNVIYTAQSHQLEQLSKKSVFYPAIIDTKSTTKRQSIDVTESLWGDRMLVVFNAWFQNYTTSKAYSNICAAFEGAECQVTSVSWNLSSIPPEFTPAQYLFYPRFNLNPWNHLDIQYNSACTQNDQDFIQTLYDALPNGTYPKEYGCIVRQFDREKKQKNSLTAEEWEEQFLITARDAVTVGCSDFLKGEEVSRKKSYFGFPLPWNNLARYLDGVDVADCSEGKCVKDPRNVEGADYCQRVLDPEESLRDLPDCQLN